MPNWGWLFVGLVVGIIIGLRLRGSNSEVVVSHPGPPLSVTPQSVLDEVRPLVQEGQMIAAIKRYRELTGADLKTSKEAVEALQRE
jgi:hypothetical protein